MAVSSAKGGSGRGAEGNGSSGHPTPSPDLFDEGEDEGIDMEKIVAPPLEAPAFTVEAEELQGDEADPFADIEAAQPKLTTSHMHRMGDFAKRFKEWKPAREVLVKVRAVPTRFIQYDRATRVGGHPIERFATIHGPSNHGKTTFCHGLGMSFLQRGHFYLFVDAEMTTPITWLSNLMSGYEDHPGFLALRPDSYEQTVDAVRDFVQRLKVARDAGELEPDTSALIVVDSIRKLVPKDLLKRIQKGADSNDKKSGGVDGMRGRGAMIKAAMNSAWLDELIPLLYHTSTSMAVIARETEGEGEYDAPVVAGGGALIYDASLVIRIQRAAWVKESSADNSPIIGERHRVQIRKTKVAGKDDKVVNSYFHTSNGVLIPEGFDQGRDLAELGEKYGILQKSGSWYQWPEVRKRWQGINAVVKSLYASPELMSKLELAVRSRFAANEDMSDVEELAK
jgi:recombination protein RecA